MKRKMVEIARHLWGQIKSEGINYQLGRILRYALRKLIFRRAHYEVSIQSAEPMMKILYIHHLEGWGIYNVGKLWLGRLKDVQTTFVNGQNYQLDKNRFKEYDFIWFGGLNLYERYPHDPQKSIVTINDPYEIFPSETDDWKSRNLESRKEYLLKLLKNIVVLFEEIHLVLKQKGINTYLIPTMGQVPAIDMEKIETEKCDLISISYLYLRKNPDLLKRLMKACENMPGVRFHLKSGYRLLPPKEYIKLLDNHEVYICTSFQEGGPLPAMEAMSRGEAVLTTPVGQIQEIIEDGDNGFICKTEKDFTDRISLVSRDLGLLQKMRVSSRKSICEKRDKKIIEEKVLTFLQELHKRGS